MTTTQPTSTKIEDYDIVYSTNANDFAPRILLKSGNNWIGQLMFEPNGSKLPADNLSNGQTILYYHLEDFENVLDLLRNVHDTPAYLTYNNGNTKFESGIVTTLELVGVG
jgi:hypothetical protein